MKVALERPLAPDSAASGKDVRAVKLALNRLGLYMPDPNIGMSDIPDGRLFDSIRAFQKTHGLAPSGRLRVMDDLTLIYMNKELESAKSKERFYRWESVGDDRVRADHADRDGQIFSWEDYPLPGEEPGCRCWAAPIKDTDKINDPPIEPAYPELLLVPLLKVGKLHTLWGLWSRQKDTEWVLGKHKSDVRWGNQLKNRNWTPKQITNTIRYGKPYKAPNKVRPEDTATRYEYDGKFVVQDDVTKEILQISGDDFIPDIMEK